MPLQALVRIDFNTHLCTAELSTQCESIQLRFHNKKMHIPDHTLSVNASSTLVMAIQQSSYSPWYLQKILIIRIGQPIGVSSHRSVVRSWLVGCSAKESALSIIQSKMSTVNDTIGYTLIWIENPECDYHCWTLRIQVEGQASEQKELFPLRHPRGRSPKSQGVISKWQGMRWSSINWWSGTYFDIEDRRTHDSGTD
jgi:hypothetical protein